jgi:c-di-GMP-binding flagellar brake protein YcgR
MKERRNFGRIKVSFTVFYRINFPLILRIRIGDKELDAIALDLSEEGMAVLTNYELPKFTIVTVKFIMVNDVAIKDEDRHISVELQGEVRYNLLLKQRTYRLGISFIDMPAEVRKFIANFVKMSSSQVRY